MFCSKCGKEIEATAAFCQYCGAKINNETEKQVKHSKIAEELNQYRYCPQCNEKTDKDDPICKHCGFDINKVPTKKLTLGETITGAIIIVFLFLFIRGCNNISTLDNTASMSPEYKKERMELTNNFMVEAQNNGIVTKLKKECSSDGKFCSYYIRVNENIWSLLSFEEKENFNRFVQEYAQLRSDEAMAEIQGHYTGKVLADKFKGVIKN